MSRPASGAAAGKIGGAGRRSRGVWLTALPLYLFTIVFVALSLIHIFVVWREVMAELAE